jgi:hypothetical protein
MVSDNHQLYISKTPHITVGSSITGREFYIFLIMLPSASTTNPKTMMAVESVLMMPHEKTEAQAPKTTSKIEIQKVICFGGVNFIISPIPF